MKSNLTGSSDSVLRHADALDVPVLVRGGPKPRPTPHWRTATAPWPANGAVPPHGWYLMTTTWREIVHHGARVGWDINPWLLQYPHLTYQELLTRISPLQAYLTLEPTPGGAPAPHNAGRRLVASVVYTHGAERSARTAFAYRLGMTMASWLSCAGMGLPYTTHVESIPPAGRPGFNDPKAKLPDLWGHHPTDALPWWLIEAKAGVKIGVGPLKRGQEQLLNASALMAGLPHRLLLAGTSVEEVFMTLDDIPVPSGNGPGASEGGGPVPGAGPSDPGEDDQALLEAALDQLLVYQHLRFGPVPDLRVVPVADHSRRSAGVVPLEDDSDTLDVRAELRRQPPADHRHLRERPRVRDFITGSVPHTGVRLGMSRRLFAACERLYQEQLRIFVETPDLFAGPLVRPAQGSLPFGSDDALDAVLREQRGRFRDRETEERGRILREVRGGYRSAGERDWVQLLGGAEPALSLGEAGMLEAAGAETYVAVRRDVPLLASTNPRTTN